MSFESFAVTLGTGDTLVYQMPSYTKTEDVQYAILPKSGALRLGFYNADSSTRTATIKVKTIFDLTPVTIGVISLTAGETKQWPVPLSLGPGDFVVASGSVASQVIVSGSVAASPIAPQTAAGETIWTNFVMRRPIDPTIAWAIASRTYGAAAAGGYFAGVIDTVTGTINASDAYQTGSRYALLVSPKSLELAASGTRRWDSRGAAAPNIAGAVTRWDGLAATNAVIATGNAEHEIFVSVNGQRSSNPPPATEGGSTWYIPALDELELFYRNLKPSAANNRTDGQAANGAAFPSPLSGHGTNPSSLPAGVTYTNNPRNPDESPLVLFKAGGAQALSLPRYWSSTEGNAAGLNRAWVQHFTVATLEGYQNATTKELTGSSVRSARRIVF